MIGQGAALVGREQVLSVDRTLELDPVVADLLPEGGLRRGSVVALSGTGSTSLLLALLAGPLARGSWGVVVGIPSLGAEAAAGLGVRLDRLALVPNPGKAWLEVTAALLGGFDLVGLGLSKRCRPGDARRLAARARERGAVLVIAPVSPLETAKPSQLWPEAVELAVSLKSPSWEGLGRGHGYLQRRHVEAVVDGRRAASRERRTNLVLPGQLDIAQVEG